jgi:hypothetical protein
MQSLERNSGTLRESTFCKCIQHHMWIHVRIQVYVRMCLASRGQSCTYSKSSFAFAVLEAILGHAGLKIETTGLCKGFCDAHGNIMCGYVYVFESIYVCVC